MSESILMKSKQLDVSELKFVELKSELKKLGLSASGNKQELQEKLENYFCKLNEKVETIGQNGPKSPTDSSKKIQLKSESLNESGTEEELNEVAKNSEEVTAIKIELVDLKNEEDKENTKDIESSSERSESVIKEVPLSGERNRFSRSKSPKPRWHHNVSEEKKVEDTCEPNEENAAKSMRKRKWLGEDFLVNKKSTPTISSETLKSFLPKNPLDNLDKQNIKENNELDDLVTIESTEENNSVNNQQRTSAIKESDNELDFEESVQELSPSREETKSQEAKSDSTQMDEKITNVLHVSNLTRPFTLNQLKELLSKYGKINEQHFWINSVKSHCYVEYETKEDAKSAKKNLHNIKWPSSNPKNLVCQYATLDELMVNMNGAPTLPNKHKDSENKENKEAKSREKEREKEKERENEKEREKGKEKENEKEREKEKEGRKEPKNKSEKIREWDLHKLRQRSRSRDRRQVENSEEKKENEEEKEPVKTFDDLFRKTTTTPFIYWLSLSEEQCAERQRENERRQMEREKRAEERRQREEAEKAQREKERLERLEREEKERKAKDEERAKERSVKENKESENKRVEEKKENVERTDKDTDRESGREKSREKDRARERDRHDERRNDVGRYGYDRNDQYRRRTPPRYESDRYRGRDSYSGRYRASGNAREDEGRSRSRRRGGRSRPRSSSGSSSRSPSSGSSSSSSSKARSSSSR